MSVLRSLESKIAGLVEGTFSRAFKSEVRPVEIARRLAREMDEHRKPSVSRVYVPSRYSVFLSAEDRTRFAGAEDEMAAELAAYLLEHARRERLVLTERPRISFETDERLGLGEFGIRVEAIDSRAVDGHVERPVDQERPAQRQERRRPPPPQPVPVSAPAPPMGAVPSSVAGAGGAALVAAGQRIELSGSGLVLGRSRSCDVVLEDPNASRRHAAVRPVSGGWQVEDLGSTNGVSVNGRPIVGQQLLTKGDVISLGHTELVFEPEAQNA
jgi:hypothetical protein